MSSETSFANSRDQLQELLHVASGGVIFTTIQKFFPQNGHESYPMLSDRKNIVVIADEAHRSQYEFITGFARHMRDVSISDNKKVIPNNSDNENLRFLFTYISIFVMPTRL